MTLQQKLRKAFLASLKYTLNPLTRRLARTRFGPFSVVQHIGRRSGRRYETPIITSPIEGGFVIELTYGPDVDWHKNVLAAGSCTLVRHGKEYDIDKIELLDAETGLAAFPLPARMLLRLLGKKDFEKWMVQQ